MKFFGNSNINKTIFAMMLIFALCSPANSQESKMQVLDNIRIELSCIKDKNSQNYIKTKAKLDKIINQNNIDYSIESRLKDIERLIYEHKYDCAKYELNELIENNIEQSLCYELLGDIAKRTSQHPKTIAGYYKTSIQYNPNNENSHFKLAKLYLREKKNIMGIEYLKEVVNLTRNTQTLTQIEGIIKNRITPENRFEANNLYEILANIYIKLNQKQLAYEALNQALILNPNDVFLKYYLGDLLYNESENNSAIAVYDSILKENQNDNQIRISKAKALYNSGNILSANKEFNLILEKNPNSIQAKYGIYQLYKNTLPKDKILEKIHFKNKNFIAQKDDYLDFAIVLNSVGEFDEAKEFEKIAREIEEKEKQATTLKNQELSNKTKLTFDKKSQENINQGNILQEKKEQTKQQKTTDKKDKQKEVNKKTQKIKSNTIKKEPVKEKNITKKEQTKKEVASEQTEEIKKAQLEKQLEEKRKKEKEAQEAQNLIKEQQLIEQETKKAQTKNIKAYNEKKKIIDEYLKTEPKTASVYVAVANTYKTISMPYSALKYFKEAIKLEPTNSDLYYNLGLSYLELNSLETARYNLIKSINLNKENLKANNLLAFVNQKIVTQTINSAYSKFEAKDYMNAFEILDNGIKKFPKNAQLYYYRALVFDAINRNAAQIIDLQQAIEYDPGYYMAYYQLGKAYEKINDERSALVAYERFLSTEPDEKELIDEIQKKVLNLGSKYY